MRCDHRVDAPDQRAKKNLIIAAGCAWDPGGFRQSCYQCKPSKLRTEEEEQHRLLLRADWGCDEPTENPQHSLECWVCEGGKDRWCEYCNGTGAIASHRCPFSIVTRESQLVIQATGLYKRQGTLPAAGGWSDQSAWLIEGLMMALREADYYEEKHLRDEMAANQGGSN